MIGTLLAVALALAPRANTLKIVVYGDCRDGYAVHRKLVADMVAEHPDFVIQTGDLVHRGGEDKLWKDYDSIVAPLKAVAPIYSVRGNHDLGGPGYEERVKAPYTSGNKLWYSFDKGGWHFVALCVDEKTSFGGKSVQYAWAKADLEKASAAGMPSIVFFHCPPYTIGGHTPDVDVQDILVPLFKKTHVVAVLSGHDHIYYRTQRDGITYVVCGGGGAPLYDVHPDMALPDDRYASINHYMVMEIDVAVAHCTVKSPSGQVFDQFDILAH